MKSLDLLNKLIAEEKKVMSSTILSPVVKGAPIRVKISGINVALTVHPKKFNGWGIFSSTDSKNATLVDEPTYKQRMDYLSLFPSAQMCICILTERECVGRFINEDRRFSGTANIQFPDGLSIFDIVQVAFDGAYFYQIRKLIRDKPICNRLVECLNAETPVDKITAPKFMLDAYNIALNYKIAAKAMTVEDRLKDAVKRGGGTFSKFTDRGSVFTVEFTVNGQKFTPNVYKETLMLENAGICLSGGDRNFDLQSFVGVASRGVDRNHIVRGDYLTRYGDRRGEEYYREEQEEW